MKVAYILAGCAVLTLAACSKKETTPKPAADAAPAIPTVVTVNGKAHHQKVFEIYGELLARRPAGHGPDPRRYLLCPDRPGPTAPGGRA